MGFMLKNTEVLLWESTSQHREANMPELVQQLRHKTENTLRNQVIKTKVHLCSHPQRDKETVPR